MSILLKDLNSLLLSFCDPYQLGNLACINKYYHKIIADTHLLTEWSDVLSQRDNYMFLYSCYKGYLWISKFLLNKYKIDIHYGGEYVFRGSCCNGHLSTAQWLVELGCQPEFGIINIHADKESAFRWSCENGYLE